MFRQCRWRLVALLFLLAASGLAQGPLAIATAALPEGTSGQPYLQSLAATGGIPPYTWSRINGSLPIGLSLSTTGIISGTPVSNYYAIILFQVSDSVGATATRTIGLVVAAPVSILSPSLFSVIRAAYANEFNLSLDAQGGTPPYTWSVDPDYGLPPGLKLGAGWILGTPTSWGTWLTLVNVTDSQGRHSSTAFFFNIVYGLEILTPSGLPPGTASKPYAQTFTGTGTGRLTWSFGTGTLPPGLVISEKGVLSGTPSSGGSYTFSLSVADEVHRGAVKTFTLVIGSAVQVLAGSLDGGHVGEPYLQTLKAQGGAGAYAWSLISGALPPGLSLTAQGALTGTPTTAGSFTFTAKAVDFNDLAASQLFSIDVLPRMDISSPTLSFRFPGTGAALSQTLSVTGAGANVKFATTVGISSGGNWLAVTPTSGVTAATLLVSANPVGLPAGLYSATLYVIGQGVFNAPRSVAVTLEVTEAKPLVSAINGASFATSPAVVAPGSIAALFGSGFPQDASVYKTTLLIPDSKPPSVSTTLSGITAKFNGIAAPLFFAGVGAASSLPAGVFQINCQVPQELPAGLAVVEVFQKDSLIAAGAVQVVPTAPGVFMMAEPVAGQAAAINEDGSLNGGAAHPAAPHSVITIYATGAGSSFKDYATGRPLSALTGQLAACDGVPLYVTASSPVVTIGGKSADVKFSGLAPCYLGLWQLNLLLPDDVPRGTSVPLTVQLGDQTSTTTTISVK